MQGIYYYRTPLADNIAVYDETSEFEIGKGIVLKKQWIIKGRKRYYVQKDGSRAQNKYVKIKGRRYYFNRSGKMVAGR